MKAKLKPTDTASDKLQELDAVYEESLRGNRP